MYITVTIKANKVVGLELLLADTSFFPSTLILASFPGLPVFFFFFSLVCIQYNTRKSKSNEKREHLSCEWCQVDARWTYRGRGPHILDFIIEHSVTRQDPRCSQDCECSAWQVRNSLSGLLHTYLLSDTTPPMTTLCLCHMTGLTLFRRFLVSVYECKLKNKRTGEAWEWGYTDSMNATMDLW